jgi:hypothetical protein
MIIQKIISIIIILVGTSVYAGGVDILQCGGAKIKMTPPPWQPSPDMKKMPDFLIEINKDGEKVVLKYSSQNEFLSMRCQADNESRLYLLVNNQCGGSGCSDWNIGLFRIDNMKEVLKADSRWKGNYEKAKTILGIKSIKPFSTKHFDGKNHDGDISYAIRF